MIFSLDWRTLAATLMASLSFAATAAHSGVGVSPSGQALPLVFEPNEGQTRRRHGTCHVEQTTPYISAPRNRYCCYVRMDKPAR